MNTKILLLYSVLFSALRMLVGATSVIYILNNGFVEKDIALLKSLQFVIVLFTDIPLSYLSDKKSKKITILLAIVFSSLWLFISGFLYSNRNIYIAEIFNALSLTFWGGAFISLLIESYLKEGKGKDTTFIIAKNKKFTSVAIFVSIAITSVVPIKNLSIIWKISSILMIILFILGIFFIKDIHDTPVKINKSSFKKDVVIIKNLFSNGSFLSLLILNILILCSFNILVQYTQIILRNNMIIPSHYFSNSSFMFSAYLMGILAVQIIAGKKMEKGSSNMYLYYALSIVVALSLLLGNKYIVLLSWIILFGLQTVIMIYVSGQIHNRIDHNIRATLDSFISSSSHLLAFIIMIIIHTRYSSSYTIYIFALIIFIIQGGVYLLTSSMGKRNNKDLDIIE